MSIVRSGEVVKPRLKPDGTHRPNGIFIGRGPDIKPAGQIEPLSILDITPCMLYLLGLPIPKDMEGKVPEAAIAPATLASRPIQRGDATKADSGKKQHDDVSDEEKEALMAQLKLLGYMD